MLRKNRRNQSRHCSQSQCKNPDLTKCRQRETAPKPVSPWKAVLHTDTPFSILTKTAGQCNPPEGLVREFIACPDLGTKGLPEYFGQAVAVQPIEQSARFGAAFTTASS